MDDPRAHEHSRLPLRAEPERLFACRPCALRAREFRDGARGRRPVPAAHRGQYEAAIYEDLAWLGVTWEEPVRRQSAHLDGYRAALARLRGLVYPSFESRGEIARLVAEREMHAPWPRDPDGAPLYPGDARSLSPAERQRRMVAGEPYALRLDMAAALARTGPLTWIETGDGSK